MAEKDKSDGYGFAIAFLAASGSIFYATYNYHQNTPIREESFFWFCWVLAIVPSSIICFLVYILIKGYLMETKNGNNANILNKLAQVSYNFALWSFVFTIMLFMCSTIQILVPELLQEIEVPPIFRYCVIFFLLPIVGLSGYALLGYYHEANRSWPPFLHLFYKPSVKKVWMYWVGFNILAVAVIFLWCCATSYTSFHGQVTIDMESVYYKNNTQIPVSIQVTGPNTGISVYLYKKNSSNSSALVSDLKSIESDFFGQESDGLSKRNLYSSNILIGSYLGNGKYYVFINTTNLSADYYELVCRREYYWKETCEGKSFYLVNKNQQ